MFMYFPLNTAKIFYLFSTFGRLLREIVVGIMSLCDSTKQHSDNTWNSKGNQHHMWLFSSKWRMGWNFNPGWRWPIKQSNDKGKWLHTFTHQGCQRSTTRPSQVQQHRVLSFWILFHLYLYANYLARHFFVVFLFLRFIFAVFAFRQYSWREDRKWSERR